MEWLRLLLDPNAAPGGGAADAAADTSLDDPNVDSLPTEGDESTADDTAEPGAEGEETLPEAGAEGSEGTQRDDGRVIPQWMRELKEKDPKAFAAAKTDLFDLRARRGIHATVKEAETEHGLIQSLGGSEGVQTLQDNARVFEDLGSQFRRGDAAFVEDLWSEDPIAAALHVQPMLDAMKAKDVEGYKGMICRIWHGEFAATGLPQGLKSLQAAIESGDKKTALELMTSINQWQQSISDMATRAEDPRVKTLLAERARGEESKQTAAKTEFFKSYRTDAVNQVVGDAAKVFDSFFKGKKLSPEDRNDLLREALSIADRAVQGDAAFTQQRDKHLERNDSNSALQLLRSRYRSELDSAVKKVARRYGMISGKPNSTTPTNQGAGKGKGTPPPSGFVRVNDRPLPEDIDRARTTNSDIFSGKATLKDGRRVTWAHLKKSLSAA